MTGSGSVPTGGVGLRKKRQFPFGLVMLAFGTILGFYGGVAATKRALNGPDWAHRLFGLPEQTVMVAAAPQPPSQPPVAPPSNIQSPPNTSVPPAAGSSSPIDSTPKSDSSDRPAKVEKADERDLMGRWETTDKLPSADGTSSTLTTAYVFKNDDTGEFDASGKKLYDFKWKPSGEDIALTYDGEGPDGEAVWMVKLRWTLNADHTLLTLIPHGGKDARSFLYNLGPGNYHHAPQTP